MATDKKSPADSLAELFELLASNGWEVTRWAADLAGNPHYVGTDPYGYAQYAMGVQNGEIRVFVAPKPKPKPFARKLRRYDVRRRRAAANEDDRCPDCGATMLDCWC